FYFVGNDGVHGPELWRSDGTAAGTIMLRDIIEGTTGSIPLNFTASHNKLYFTVEPTLGDRRLWVSDGTPAGTVQVRAGIGPESGQGLAVSGDSLYFTADDGIAGNELWQIAGSDEVMEMVADITPGPGSSRAAG